MQQYLLVFPTLLGANHLAMSSWSPFYNAFAFEQKCEWLAWTNTVVFQSWFTSAYFSGASANYLGHIFLAYVLYDTVFLFFYNRNRLMYVHHTLALLVSGIFEYLGQAEYVPPAVIYLESSNILLGITWLLNRAGYAKTQFFKIIGGIALLIYVVNRTFLFPYHLVFVAPRAVMIGMFPFVPMNHFWSWKLISYYAYTAFGKKLGG